MMFQHNLISSSLSCYSKILNLHTKLFVQVNLIFIRQLRCSNEQSFHRRQLSCNECIIMNRRESQHKKLTVHSIHQPSVTGKKGLKVLNAVGPFNGTRHKSPERSDDGGKESIHQSVQLNGVESDAGGRHRLERGEVHAGVEGVLLRQKHRVHFAIQNSAGWRNDGELVSGTREPRELGEQHGEEEGKHASQNPPPNEALPRLVGG